MIPLLFISSTPKELPKTSATFRVFLTLLVLLSINIQVFSQIEKPLNPKLQQQQQTQSEEQLAINYYRNQQFEQAAALFKPLFEQKRTQYLYMYYLNCLLELNDLKEAEKVIKKQRREYPQNYRYLIDQAYVYEKTGNEKKAQKLFEELMSNLPNERNSIMTIASSLQTRGYSNLAVLVYKKARQNPDMQYAFNMEIANVYMFSGDYEKVFDSYLDQLETNPEDIQRIRNQLQSILRMDVDDNLSDEFRKKLLTRAQANTESEALAEMLLWYSIQVKDFTMALRQAKSIDKRFGFREEAVMELAEIAFQNRQFEIAGEAYNYIREKKDGSPYYLESTTGFFRSQVQSAELNPATTSGEYQKLLKQGDSFLKELGINSQTIEIERLLAHIQAFRLNQSQEAIDRLSQVIELKGLKPDQTAMLKLELADIWLINGQIWEATLLYSQVESDMKNEPLGHEAKLKNARVFYYAGEFGWAQAKLDILKSATSKLISNDAIDLSLFIEDILEEDTLGLTLRKFAGADLSAYQQHYDSAMILLQKIESTFPGEVALPYVMYKKAEWLSQQQHFLAADSLYTQFIERYPEHIKADNALYQQGELRRSALNDTDGALSCYLKLMTNYPESLFAGESRIRYRTLREENLP